MKREIFGGKHIFTEDEYQITITLRNIRKTSGSGYTSGYITIERPVNTRIFSGRVFLDDSNSREKMVRKSFERDNQISIDTWDRVIEMACIMAYEDQAAGDPPVILSQVNIDERSDFLLKPMVLAGAQGTMIYAQGGSMKSYLAAYLATVMMVNKGLTVGVLDWETDKYEWAKRLHRIARGMGIQAPDMPYRFMSSTLVDKADDINDWVSEKGIDVLIVDSLSAAMGGEVTESMPTINFFASLRIMKIPVLIIHHANREGTHYGSVYIRNYVRLQYHLMAEPLSDGSSYKLTATSEKANNLPSGMKKSWVVNFAISDPGKFTEGDMIKFSPYEEPPAQMSSQQIIENSLMTGPMRVQWLAEAVNMPEERVRIVLSDMMRQRRVIVRDDEQVELVIK